MTQLFNILIDSLTLFLASVAVFSLLAILFKIRTQSFTKAALISGVSAFFVGVVQFVVATILIPSNSRELSILSYITVLCTVVAFWIVPKHVYSISWKKSFLLAIAAFIIATPLAAILSGWLEVWIATQIFGLSIM